MRQPTSAVQDSNALADSNEIPLSDRRARLRAALPRLRMMLDSGTSESASQSVTDTGPEAAPARPPDANTARPVSSTGKPALPPAGTTPRLADVESFTRGSNEDEVLRIQGTPTRIQRYDAFGYEDWYYGLNKVSISIATRRVTEWSNSTGALKVRMVPGANVTGSEFFSRGSHEDEVLRIQGTPTRIQRYEAFGYEDWYYGLNKVSISMATRRVTEWSNSTGALKVRMVPGANVTGSEFFSRGSHEDDVLRIQGTPTRIQRYDAFGYEDWYYGLNKVTISMATRRVTEWSNSTGALKVRMVPVASKDSGNEASATLERSS